MKASLFLVIFTTVLTVALLPASLHAQSKSKAKTPAVPAPIESPDQPAITSSIPRVTEFQGDDTSLVLRTLARQANMDVVIDLSVKGTSTLRVQNKTPREVMDVVVKMNDLIMEEKKGVFYIRSRNPSPEDPKAKSNDFNEETFATVVPIVTKIVDAMLDYEARPETAKKLAKSKKVLFDALIAEGFTREEAMQIVLSDRGLSFFGLKR
jgi:type II secretory pathway component HofQ